MNLFIKNYEQIDNKNIVVVSEDNQSTNILVSKTTDVRDRNEMMKKIINNINSLDVSIRLAFDMYRNGYNYSQIAASFNIPLETVTERVLYAKKVVRDTIMKNYSDYYSLPALTA
ncbi:MAG: sigma-70 family RNA polymerase sigma factor [Saprospiraceae bacterium]|nr:sigma-70 family RNA polymerase sigma factor [Saprospiraceae bacterium]